jgi:hypothetical protein
MQLTRYLALQQQVHCHSLKLSRLRGRCITFMLLQQTMQVAVFHQKSFQYKQLIRQLNLQRQQTYSRMKLRFKSIGMLHRHLDSLL